MSNKWMAEYENIGDMSRIEKEKENDDSKKVFYIPYLSAYPVRTH